VRLVSIFKHQKQCKTQYVNQRQHRSPAGIEANVKKLNMHEAFAAMVIHNVTARVHIIGALLK
jgi:hypothetical protein